MRKPFTGCAGQVVHHPTTPTFFPREPRISQTGRARHRFDVVGDSFWVSPGLAFARRDMKSRTPCLLGTFPVAMLAQMMGLLVSGSRDRNRPAAPSSRRRVKFGAFF